MTIVRNLCILRVWGRFIPMHSSTVISMVKPTYFDQTALAQNLLEKAYNLIVLDAV